MAFFGVTMETLEKIYPHPDADSLELAKIRGMSFQFVVLKGKHKEGDKVIYFPVDSVVPENVLVKMNLSGKLSGSQKNRVKSIFLRKQLSQGLVEFPDRILSEEFLATNPGTQEITNFLGVTKYEPPVITTPSGVLKHLPENCSVYDIEGADRNQHIIDLLCEEDEVVVTEKMEGTNFSIKRDADNKVFVNSRSNTIEEESDHKNMYWEAARSSGLIIDVCNMPQADVIVYAELCGPGIQKNIYKLTKPTLFIFDIKIDGKWVDYNTRQELCEKYMPNQKVAPLLFKGKLKDYLGESTIQEKADAPSLVNPSTGREGIVLETANEVKYIQNYGRLKIKQRGPIYLCKTDF